MSGRITLREALTSTQEGQKKYQQERTILAVTEMICEVMEQEQISRVELAHRLGRTKGFVSQILDGTANMTMRTLSDIMTELGRQFEPTCSRLDRKTRLPDDVMVSLRTGCESVKQRWPEARIVCDSLLSAGAADEHLNGRLAG